MYHQVSSRLIIISMLLLIQSISFAQSKIKSPQFIQNIFSEEKPFDVISLNETFSTLSKITESTKVISYSNGGDFDDILVYTAKEMDGAYNLYVREKVLNDNPIAKTSGFNINLAPNYCMANNKIVFQYLNKGNFDIAYVDAGNGKNKSITSVTNTAEDEFNPSWSPDGKIIVYEKGKTPPNHIVINKKTAKMKYESQALKNQIWLKNIDSKELKILGIGSFPKISPDGKQIVFIKFEPIQGKTKEMGTIWVMSIDGEQRSRVTDINLGNASNPNWSPDGKNIVFELSKKDKPDSDIYTIDISGDNLRQHTFNKSSDFAPHWTINDFIYFSSDRGAKKDNFQIWRFKIK